MAKKKQKKAQGGTPLPPPTPTPPPPPVPAEPRYPDGSQVRVRAGVTDPDYPDITMGGWVGTVNEADLTDEGYLYLVDWSEETLDALPEAYFVRCERNGLDPESTRLGENDLEANNNRPVSLRPLILRPPPLDMKDPEDRMRVAFGLTSDQPLPSLSMESLARYHAYLSKHLRLPRSGLMMPGEGSSPRMVRIVRLMPVDEADLSDGLTVEVRDGNETEVMPLISLAVEPGDGGESAALDYMQWFTEADIEEEDEEDWEEGPAPPPISLVRVLSWFLATGMVGGAALAALIKTIPGAEVGAQVVAVLLGIPGLLFGGFLEAGMRRGSGRTPYRLVGWLTGGTVGAAIGGLVGALVVGYPGSIPGSIAGNLLGQLLRKLKIPAPGTFALTLAGATIGGLVLAYLTKPDEAWNAALLGGLIGGLGLGGGAILLMIYAVVLGIGPRE